MRQKIKLDLVVIGEPSSKFVELNGYREGKRVTSPVTLTDKQQAREFIRKHYEVREVEDRTAKTGEELRLEEIKEDVRYTENGEVKIDKKDYLYLVKKHKELVEIKTRLSR